MAVSKSLERKHNKLKKILKGYKKLAIAFSGGVDSTLLLKIACEVLGEHVIAIYVDSPLQPEREKKAVQELIRSLGAEMDVFSVNELNHSAFQENPPDRCYYCKGLIFDNIIEVAHLKGISDIADGSNYDDNKDYRPGNKALKERNIHSPLQEAELTKEEIRILSKAYGLPTWNKDALACLATRIPFGESVTEDKLKKVDSAEAYLNKLGFRNVRARYFGKKVFIEVSKDQVDRLRDRELFKELEKKMENIGFSQIEIAPDGYKQGRMNP